MAQNNALSVKTILFGRYQIERVIGQGGFGITYYARHMTLGSYVAIKEFFLAGICHRTQDGKVTFQDFSPQKFEKFRKRFTEEASTLCKLSNPHVVSVRDIFDENGTSYIVMDYVSGETLQKKVEREGALQYDVAVNYMAQLCEAVEHIHAHHILHRDIKPENIIITPQNNVVLIDFGSARSFVHDKEQKHTAMLTMGYAPIEQYTATSKKGNYTDLYAVGGTFYFILTGKKPIAAADRMMHDELPEPRALNPQIPLSANQTIMKALNLMPENRYQEVGNFMHDLLGETAEVPPMETKEAKKSNGLVIAGVILAGVLVAILTIWIDQSDFSFGGSDSTYVDWDSIAEVEEPAVASVLDEMEDNEPAISTRSQIEISVAVASSQCPMKVDDCTTVTEVKLEGNNVVYKCLINETNLGSSVSNFKNADVKKIMKAAMVESLRQEASDLVKMCKDGNFNIVYRYIGSKSGSKVDIKIKASEL